MNLMFYHNPSKNSTNSCGENSLYSIAVLLFLKLTICPIHYILYMLSFSNENKHLSVMNYRISYCSEKRKIMHDTEQYNICKTEKYS
jgi:hypothetical protein